MPEEYYTVKQILDIAYKNNAYPNLPFEIDPLEKENKKLNELEKKAKIKLTKTKHKTFWRTPSFLHSYTSTSIYDRIDSFRGHRMNLKKELLNLKKARKKLTNEQYVKYVKDFKEADKCNKESFEKHLMIRKILPIFKKTPKKIIQLIKNEYAENPASAGNFAQDVLSFTQLTNNLYLANCSKEDYEKINPLREITCKTHFPNSNICIGWQVDLFQEEMLYEFKLTTEKNFEKTLQKQLLQLCLYDFLFRKEYAHKYPLIVKSELKKIIEVYLMDKDEIDNTLFIKQTQNY